MCVNIFVHNHRKRLSGYDALLSIQHLTLFEDTTVEKKITSGILMLRSIFIFYSLNGINFIWFQFNLHSSEHKSVFCLLHSSVFRFTVERKHHKNHKRQLHNHICSSPVFRDNLNKNLPIHCQHMKWLKSILCIFFPAEVNFLCLRHFYSYIFYNKFRESLHNKDNPSQW